MANLVSKDDIWIVRFRFSGREYKRSLKTRDKADAEAGKRTVEQTLYRLRTGLLQLPADVDPGDFIVSGGTLVAIPMPAPPIVFPTTRSLIDRYLESKKDTIADTYYSSQTTHLRHLKKHLGGLADRPCNLVTQQTLERFVLKRLKVRDPNTVKRERTTLLQFYKWVAQRDDVPEFLLPTSALPTCKSSVDRPPFRTIEEVNEICRITVDVSMSVRTFNWVSSGTDLLDCAVLRKTPLVIKSKSPL